MPPILRDFLKACDTVLRRLAYAAIAGLSALAIALFALWLPSFRLLVFVSGSDALRFGDKLNAAFALLGTSLRSLPSHELGLIFATAVLFGLNVAFAAFYVRRTVAYERAIGASAAGLLLSIVGIGCAACGSVLLSAILGTAASIGLLGVLPLRGSEFAILGILILVAAVLNISKKIVSPLICGIPKKG
jgi:hypothetical protein